MTKKSGREILPYKTRHNRKPEYNRLQELVNVSHTNRACIAVCSYIICAVLTTVTLFASGLSAQSSEQPVVEGSKSRWLSDFDKRFDIKTERPPWNFYWSFNLLQEAHFYENADLRDLDEKSDLSIQYTDDRQSLALTRAKLDTLSEFPEQKITVEAALGFDGVWGHDQLQGYSNPGLRISRANISWDFLSGQDLASSLIIGRQYFDIGGQPVDHMQKDILDAVTVVGKWKGIMDLKLLLLDVFSGANSYGAGGEKRWNDDFKFFTRDEEAVTEAQQGDVSTYRWGVVASFKELLAPLALDPRLYAYYAAIRGNDGGADRSQNGQIGNFPDNDWAAMFGGRLSYVPAEPPLFHSLTLYVDAAASTGQDLKRDEEPEAEIAGIGAGGGLASEIGSESFAIIIEADIFWASGPEYDENGNLVTHSFVSFKGDEVGGLLGRRYWGIHPSAYTDDNGIDDKPHDANKKSGMTSLHAGVGARFGSKYLLRLDYWILQDNGSSDVDFSNADSAAEVASSNKFLSEAEVEAQERLGESIGQEFNIYAEYNPNSLLKFYGAAGFFIPGPFFDIPVEDVVSQNGVPKGDEADANFYAVTLGTEMSF